MTKTLYTNANILQSIEGHQYRVVKQGAVLARDGLIDWVGFAADADSDADASDAEVIDLAGAWLLPGLIDCHTHLVYAGSRANEFEMRQHGRSYEAIANEGGGILSTVAATRAASEDELFEGANQRLQPYLKQGVTTLEVKSGYGLDVENELKILRVAKRLEDENPIRIMKTCLAAHAVPPEYAGRSGDYIALVCNEILPRVAQEKLADFVDVFTESIGFSLEETTLVFEKAKRLNLAVKCHAEQLSQMGAAKLAAEYHALSCDHLEYITDTDVAAMQANKTVPVLLPGAYYYLKEKKVPPLSLMREAGLKIAIATDCNPGSAPCNNLLLMMNMACVLWGMTPQEAFKGVTENAAAALGLYHSLGQVRTGFRADFSIWHIEHPRELAASFELRSCEARVFSGQYFSNE